jgi:hypothetical protein
MTEDKAISSEVSDAIEQSQRLTVQEAARRGGDEGAGGGGFSFLNFLARAGELMPPWWSWRRDEKLREFWKSSDHLSGTMYTMGAKMTAIPVKVVAKNRANRVHVQEAQEMTEIINMAPGYGQGWVTEFGKWVEDLTGQDNGAFFEVIGAGRKDQAIVGNPISVNNLDASRCWRTGDAIFPVVYLDDGGQKYKLHYSRVMFSSQMASPLSQMNGVGFCAVSRCVSVAQTLIDILVYKQEKLGSRPHRKILITRGGLDPNDMSVAFRIAASRMDAKHLKRYSQIVIGGQASLPEAELKEYDLASLPDGFDEQTSIMLGMATIALAFGTDARELFPAMTAGATRADALLQHLKQRGKGPGQILLMIEHQMNFKFMPPHLRFVSDFQDDSQDRQRAEIAMIRANKRVQDQSTGAITDRVMHEQMVDDGDISQEQFDLMEVRAGRLPNGDPVVSLFYDKSGEFSRYLDLGIENPLDLGANDPEAVFDAVADKRAVVMTVLANDPSPTDRWTATVSESALNTLELLYIPTQQALLEEEAATTSVPGEEGESGGEEGGGTNGKNGRPSSQFVDPRQRRIDLTVPTGASASLGETLNAPPGKHKGLLEEA